MITLQQAAFHQQTAWQAWIGYKSSLTDIAKLWRVNISTSMDVNITQSQMQWPSPITMQYMSTAQCNQVGQVRWRWCADRYASSWPTNNKFMVTCCPDSMRETSYIRTGFVRNLTTNRILFVPKYAQSYSQHHLQSTLCTCKYRVRFEAFNCCNCTKFYVANLACGRISAIDRVGTTLQEHATLARQIYHLMLL